MNYFFNLSIGTDVEKKFKIMELKPLENRLEYGPDFICIGAQKSCTSWLHWNLFFHPDTAMPPEKESNYFKYDLKAINYFVYFDF